MRLIGRGRILALNHIVNPSLLGEGEEGGSEVPHGPSRVPLLAHRIRVPTTTTITSPRSIPPSTPAAEKAESRGLGEVGRIPALQPIHLARRIPSLGTGEVEVVEGEGTVGLGDGTWMIHRILDMRTPIRGVGRSCILLGIGAGGESDTHIHIRRIVRREARRVITPLRWREGRGWEGGRVGRIVIGRGIGNINALCSPGWVFGWVLYGDTDLRGFVYCDGSIPLFLSFHLSTVTLTFVHLSFETRRCVLLCFRLLHTCIYIGLLFLRVDLFLPSYSMLVLRRGKSTSRGGHYSICSPSYACLCLLC